MKINNVRNNLISCAVNMKINEVKNDINGANGSYVPVQFVGYPAGKNHQNLLSSQEIGIRHEKVLVLDPPMETSIGANNQTDLTISTGVVQAPKALKLPTMEEVTAITTAYNTGADRTPRGVSRTGVDGSTPVTSGTRAVDDGSGTSAVCTITPPPSGRMRKGSIWNYTANYYPKVQ